MPILKGWRFECLVGAHTAWSVPKTPPPPGACCARDVNDIVHGLSISSYRAVFRIGLPPRHPRRDLDCYLYHSEKILTHPTPPGLTELVLIADKPFVRHALGMRSHNADAFGSPYCRCTDKNLIDFSRCKKTHYGASAPFDFLRLPTLIPAPDRPTGRSLAGRSLQHVKQHTRVCVR